MQESFDEEIKTEPVHETFLGILMFDVIAAMQRRADKDNQSSRRELIRTLFVSIEGLVWVYREHIIDVARTVDAIAPEEEVILSEKAYAVTDQGKIVKTTRFIPLISVIRLLTKLAAKIDPKLEQSFNEPGWNDFRRALNIRHRLTHPKSKADLHLSKNDVSISYSGFDWIFQLCLTAMDSATEAQKSYLAEFTILLEKLKQGDPSVLAEYHAAAQSTAER